MDREVMHLVRFLNKAGQYGSQLQKLTCAVPGVEVQVQIRQPHKIGECFRRCRTETVSGEIQTPQANQTSETKRARKKMIENES